MIEYTQEELNKLGNIKYSLESTRTKDDIATAAIPIHQITWAFTQEAGAIPNPTFNSLAVPAAWLYLERWWAIHFVQVAFNANPRVKVMFPKNTIGGWADANKDQLRIRIHPTVNWSKSLPTCVNTMIHEFFHLATIDFGGQHIPSTVPPPPKFIMEPYPRVGLQITERDAKYMRVYAYKTVDRPWLHPNLFRETFMNAHPAVSESLEKSDVPFCGCSIHDA